MDQVIFNEEWDVLAKRQNLDQTPIGDFKDPDFKIFENPMCNPGEKGN
jgi:hypothetical protein